MASFASAKAKFEAPKTTKTQAPAVAVSNPAKIKKPDETKDEATVSNRLQVKANEIKDKAALALQDAKTQASQSKEKAIVALRNMQAKAGQYCTKDAAVTAIRNPQFQTCAVATAGGAIVFGTVGGAFGLASGVVVGSAAGVVPALFTFGLSIPVGGAIGGIGGACAGTLVGGASGGMSGFTVYKYRVEIKDGMIVVKVKAQNAYETTKLRFVSEAHKLRDSVTSVANRGKQNSIKALGFAKSKASDAVTFATTTKVGVTSSSAAAGAVVGGAATGAVGTVVGAAVGVVPAIFTFGLSIPAGALVGLCVGTTVGGGAGAVGGGVLGYGGFTYRQEISARAQSSWNKVSTKADELKIAAFAHASDAKESVRSMVRGSTGGSAR